jgi:hypothetical protein
LLIDDWDSTPLSIEEQHNFLQLAAKDFETIVLTSRGISSISYIYSKLEGRDEFLKYALVSLSELSFARRGELIENWLSHSQRRDDPKFVQRLEHMERIVNDMLGRSTLPSVPLIVLGILEAANQEQSALPETGSFGYLYEALITRALSTSSGAQMQLDKKYNLLSYLAFQMFRDSSEFVTTNEYAKLCQDYCDKYYINIDGKMIFDDLIQARVLLLENGNISFAYDHYYYYFLARAFKRAVKDENDAWALESIRRISENIRVSQNRTFLLFYIYLTNDSALIDDILTLSDLVLSGFPECKLRNEVEFLDSLNLRDLQRTIPKSVDLDKARRSRRTARDQARKPASLWGRNDRTLDVSATGYSSELATGEKIGFAFSCLDVLGQIIRNFAGTLPGNRKVQIIECAYRLSLRTLGALLLELQDAFEAVIEKHNLASASKEDIAEAKRQVSDLSKLILNFGELLCYSVIRSVSLSVGSSDIDIEAFRKALSVVGETNATKLIHLSIQLDHYTDYPVQYIRNMKDELSRSRYCTNVLRNIIIENMHVFPLDREIRQRVLQILDAQSAEQSIVASSTRRIRNR